MLDNQPAHEICLDIPDWVPDAARNYLVHTEHGLSIRQLAKGAGCHASTILRQVRKTESRRDDPLVDEAMSQLGAGDPNTLTTTSVTKEYTPMNAQIRQTTDAPDEVTINREARRILRRMCETSACLAVARDMDKAVVVREMAGKNATRTTVVDRRIAQAMALKDWIICNEPGRISRYQITTAGRSALKRLLAEEYSARAGSADPQSPFADQHRDWGNKEIRDPDSNQVRRIRYNSSESPVSGLARRKDRDGKPFLSPELVNAAERLREDFELAQMGPRVTQNWENFLSSGDRGAFNPSGGTGGRRWCSTQTRCRRVKRSGAGTG